MNNVSVCTWVCFTDYCVTRNLLFIYLILIRHQHRYISRIWHFYLGSIKLYSNLPSMIKLYGGLLSSLPVNVFRTRQAYGVAASAGRLARSTCKSPEGTTWNFPSAKWEKETNFLLERELCYCFSFSKLLFCCKIVSHASYGVLIYITKWKLL